MDVVGDEQRAAAWSDGTAQVRAAVVGGELVAGISGQRWRATSIGFGGVGRRQLATVVLGMVFILDLGAAMVRWLLWILVKHGFVIFGDCWLQVVMDWVIGGVFEIGFRLV
ncbi:hypothetical protein M0R45_008777 [Rubus argutus]|uniref:Uncharacterized protein n=1 Tax=Rubus argutus TaxID=59490 RepID=A0AAW1Y2R2_RUBAR